MTTFLQRFDVRVSLAYGVIASLWIILSDSLVTLIFGEDPAMLATISVLKGLGYVVITALALFVVLRAELLKHIRLENALQNDLIKHKMTEQQLRIQSAALEAAASAILITDRNGKIEWSNPAFTALTGYTDEEALGKNPRELVHSGVHDQAFYKNMWDTILAGSVWEGQLINRRKDGSLYTEEQVITPVRNAQGEINHFIAIKQDVTQKRTMEEQLRYQALLLMNVSDAIISTDINFNIRSWNPAAETIYGWQADEVIGKRISEFVHGKYPNTTQEEAIKQLQTEGEWRGEAIHQRKNGSYVHLLASTSYITDNSGNQIGVVSVNRDITESKKVQEAVQEAERSRMELEKERELMALKENFQSMVSHEFRTPLSVIISSAELVQRYYDRMPRERQLKHIQEVLSQADFMVGLMNDVLTINKARAGRVEFNPFLLDMKTFSQETLERIQVVDDGKHKFTFTHEGELSNMMLDPKLLQHILVNLLSNAVKYSPGGGEVHLEVRRENGNVVIRVSDRGIGIPEEALPHLYEPFHRATNTGNIGGTGLGLAIVKESVDLHNGTIDVESQEGAGTTFTVRLPVGST